MRRPLFVLTLALALVPLLPPGADAGADPTSPEEMLWIYELNLMRWNPAAYGIAGDPSPPIAVNDQLAAAAHQKAAYMAANSYCGHALPRWSNQMALDHGFPLPSWWAADTNFIEATWCSSAESALPSQFAFVFGNPYHHDLVLGRGWYANHREVGVGFDVSGYSGFSVLAAPRDGYDLTPAQSPVFITGVVFDDHNGNGRMDLGEGRSGATVTAQPGSHVTTTNGGGGYSILIGAPATGTYAVASPGAGSGSVTISGDNVGVDFVAGRSEPIVRADGNAERWWGDDRYGTAVAVSQQTHPSGSAVAFVAVGEDYPDAIAAGPAAAAENAPILLTRTTSLPAVTRDELIRLAPSTVVVVGGPAAVSDGVVDEVSNALPGVSIQRRWGATRYETAVDVSRRSFGSASTVFVATGENYPDALVAAPAAVVENAPLLLVKAGAIPQAVRDELLRLDPARIVVMGGTAAIGSGVFAELQAYAGSVQRITAANRYDLAAEVSERYFAAPAGVVYVAVGTAYPDALAAGPATGAQPGPVMLVPPWDVPQAVGDELTRLAPDGLVILGGPVAVPTAIEEELEPYISE